MTYGQVLVETYLEDIDELKSELDELTYYPGYDGEIVEKYVTCPRPNCVCHRGYPHGPHKYYRYRENNQWKELYLGKKIIGDYLPKVESNQRIKDIKDELRRLEKQLREVRAKLADEKAGEGAGT